MQKLQIRNRQLFVEFNSKAQILMINAINSLITKNSDVQSTDFNFLFQTNTAIIIVLFATNVDNAFMTTLLIIFKNKSIKSNNMRFYKDSNVNEHVR